jgi:nucleoside recognition membrane protein YjiH
MTDFEHKITWRAWFSFVFIMASFSGIFTTHPILCAIDFQTLIGTFGKVGDAGIFIGKGGIGARDGFMFGLTLIPTVMFALGLIRVVESQGALLAAEKLIRPILRPLMGLPGVTGLAIASSMTSTDVGAAMTKTLYEEGQLTDTERSIFVAYQYAGSGVITNTFDCGAPLLAIAVMPVGIILAIEIFVKVLGANLIRFYLLYKPLKKKEKNSLSVDSL